jgi:putative transposase
VRAECLDWLLILNRRHLERVLGVYVDHYKTQRQHRALKLQPPEPEKHHPRSTAGEIRRRDRSAASSTSTTEPPHGWRHE